MEGESFFFNTPGTKGRTKYICTALGPYLKISLVCGIMILMLLSL